MKHTIATAAGLAALSFVLVGCSGDSKTDTPAVTSISSLPKSTGKVSSAKALTAGWEKNAALATTGVKFVDLDSSFSSANIAGKSRGLCESGQVARDLYRDAAMPDMTSCYVGVMEKHKLFTKEGVWKLVFTDDTYGTNATTTMLVKYDETEDESGNITNFKMHTCQGSTPTQDTYANIDLGATTTITAVYNFTASYTIDSTSTLSMKFQNRTTGSGKISDKGEWSSKTMTGKGIGDMTMKVGTESATSSMQSYAKVDEFSNAMDIDAWWSGNFKSGNYEWKWSDNGFATIQLINPGELNKMALGNGTIRYTVAFDTYLNSTKVTSDSDTATGYESWNGDDQKAIATASSGEFYTYVSGKTPTSVGTIAATDVTFGTGETWDCSGTPEGTIDFNTAEVADPVAFAADFADCDADYNIAGDGTWINCEDATITTSAQ